MLVARLNVTTSKESEEGLRNRVSSAPGAISGKRVTSCDDAKT